MIVHGEGDRYVVSAVTGYPFGGGPQENTAFAVLDTLDNWREVASFHSLRGSGAPSRREKARRACDLLNAAERVGA